MALVCLVVLFAALLFFTWDARKRWVLRVFGDNGRRRRRRIAVRGTGARVVGAGWLLDECGRLQSAGAGWPDVLAALNPRGDLALMALLGRVRAAFALDALGGLHAIALSCRVVLSQNPSASAADALADAATRVPFVTSARW